MLLDGAPNALDLTDSRDQAALAEIKWVVDSANVLGQQRDDFAHTLLIPLIANPYFVAWSFTGHKPAQSLAGKSILPELKLLRRQLIVLEEYADDHVWPPNSTANETTNPFSSFSISPLRGNHILAGLSRKA
jgi:hypothetical protein